MNNNADIGRKLDGVLQKPGRQLAMVFDLNKCLDCHTCAVSCIFPDFIQDPAQLVIGAQP